MRICEPAQYSHTFLKLHRENSHRFGYCPNCADTEGKFQWQIRCQFANPRWSCHDNSLMASILFISIPGLFLLTLLKKKTAVLNTRVPIQSSFCCSSNFTNKGFLFSFQLIQRFSLEYHEEPVGTACKYFLVPDRQVRIRFIDRH